jgi:rod shape-determining protein MreD
VSRLPGPVWRLLAVLVGALLPSLLPTGWPARPDVVLLVVVAAGLVGGPATGALTGLAAGWVVDLVPPGAEPLGASALVYLAAGAIGGGLRRYATWSPVLPLVAVLAAACAVQGVRVLASAAGAGTATVPAALWAVGLTLAVGLVLLPLLVVVERALLRRGWA